VFNNNFYNNEQNAFSYNERLSWMISNKWNGNYWDRGRILPYLIPSQILFFIWFQIDWHPALVPNEF
jgi:hypothetical protein